MLASVFGSVHSTIHSTAFSIAEDGVIVFLAVVWLGFAYRVHRDARRRIDDGRLVGFATLLGMVPLIGPSVYVLFRPPETLADVRAREIEMRALRTRLAQSEPRCPVCLSEVENDYLVCPVCTTRLREPCTNCDAPLEALWQTCPYCATPVGVTRSIDAADLDAALSAEAAIATGEIAQQPLQG
ncbi:MAG: zinc ribbon domain-containing protein [Actinobacteria bacterium]|nr:zinc ribbon domain-containing protein [Actinomycetota bacterium]